MQNIQAFFDGSCEPINPGGTAKWGFVILDSQGDIIKAMSGVVGSGEGMTNNVAEYQALIACLKYLHEHHRDDFIEIFGDSLMIVNMTKGVWGKKKPHHKMIHLVPLLWEARRLFESLRSVSLAWVPREQNLLADYYSKR